MAVHPHSRGEHYIQPAKFLVGGGSSPLARGTHFLHHIDLPGQIIAHKFYRLTSRQDPQLR